MALVLFCSNMDPLVVYQVTQMPEALLALTALVRSFATVQPLVALQGLQICKSPRTFLASEWSLARVNTHMVDQSSGLNIAFATYFAFVWFLSSMESLVPA